MNWRKNNIRGFKKRKPKNIPAMPVRTATSSAFIPMWMLGFLVGFAMVAGAYTGFHMMVADVYESCATKGQWHWNSVLLNPKEPIKCSVPKTMLKEQ